MTTENLLFIGNFKTCILLASLNLDIKKLFFNHHKLVVIKNQIGKTNNNL